MDKLQVRLFGSTAVTLPDRSTVADLGGIKPRQILEMLAVSLGTPVPKDRLADQLWDGAPPRTWVGTLESYVSLVRRRLCVARGRHSAIATTSNGYLLDPALVDVDLDTFRRLVQPTARTSRMVAVARAERATGLVTGTLLASEPYAEWALRERTLFQGELVQACNRASELALGVGQADTALRLARCAIAADAVAETAWQHLMRALSALGSHSEALRAYLDLRSITVSELGAEPGPESRALYLRLLDETGTTGGQASTHEVRTLLQLLRHALEGFPGLDLPRADSGLAEVAARVVGAA